MQCRLGARLPVNSPYSSMIMISVAVIFHWRWRAQWRPKSRQREEVRNDDCLGVGRLKIASQYQLSCGCEFTSFWAETKQRSASQQGGLACLLACSVLSVPVEFWFSLAQNFVENRRVTETIHNKNIWLLIRKAWRFLWINYWKDIVLSWRVFCNHGFAKYTAYFPIAVPSLPISFYYNSSSKWRSYISKTICGSDRPSAKTFMPKYSEQSRGKQTLIFST